MKEKILSMLKTTYKDLGLSEDLLSSTAEMLALSVNSDEGIEKAVQSAQSFLKSVQSTTDKIRTESKKKNDEMLKQQQDKLSKLEEMFKTLNGNGEGGNDKKDDSQTDTSKNEEIPSWAKGFMTSLENLTKGFESLKSEKLTETRKAQFAKATDGLPESIKKIYSRYDISKSTDEEFKTLLTDIEKDREDFSKDFKSSKGVFSAPKFGNGEKNSEPKEATKEEIEEVASKIII